MSTLNDARLPSLKDKHLAQERNAALGSAEVGGSAPPVKVRKPRAKKA